MSRQMKQVQRSVATRPAATDGTVEIDKKTPEEDTLTSAVMVPEKAKLPMELYPGEIASLPQRMVIAGVRLTGAVALTIARSITGAALLRCAEQSAYGVARGLAADAALTSRFQQQAIRQIIIRVPLLGPATAERFCTNIISSPGLQGGFVQQVSSIGFSGHVLMVGASLLVNESRDVLYLASGQLTGREFGKRSVVNLATGAGTLAGSVGGTCIGALALPGIGLGLGSFAGSIIGAPLGEAAVAGVMQYVLPDDANSGHGCAELLLEPAPEGQEEKPGPLRIECDLGSEEERRALEAEMRQCTTEEDADTDWMLVHKGEQQNVAEEEGAHE